MDRPLSRGVRRWELLAVLALAVVLYLPTLGFGFVFDDAVHITANPDVTGADRFPAALLSPTWPGDLYRPLLTASLAATFALAGNDPLPYHLTNVMLHGLAAALVLALVFRLTGRRRFSLVTALLFSVHPAHIEVVANVAYRTELLAACFGLGALLVVASPRRAPGFWRPAAACVLALAALCSKESGAVLLLLGPLCLMTSPAWSRPSWTAVARNTAPLALALAAYIGLRAAAFGGLPWTDPRTNFIDNPLIYMSFFQRLPHALAGLGLALQQAFVPLLPSADYSFARIDPAAAVGTAAFWLRLVVGGGALLGAGWAVVARLRGGDASRDRAAVALWGGWFFSAMAVSANLAFPIGTVFGDRLIYLPSVGACAVAAGLLLRPHNRRLATALCGLVAVGCVALVLHTAPAWRSNRALFTREATISPRSAKTRLNLGVALMEAGQTARAIPHLRASHAIYPRGFDAAYTLGVALMEIGRAAEAHAPLERALALRPGHFYTLVALGKLSFNRNNPARAERMFRRALNKKPNDYNALLGMVAVSLRKGDRVAAQAYFGKIPAKDRGRPEVKRFGRMITGRR